MPCFRTLNQLQFNSVKNDYNESNAAILLLSSSVSYVFIYDSVLMEWVLKLT